MKFSIKDFFNKYEEIYSDLLKKSLPFVQWFRSSTEYHQLHLIEQGFSKYKYFFAGLVAGIFLL